MSDVPAHRNEVVLVGRVTSPAVERLLPSGDTLWSWRITVDRDGGGFDAVDCAAWAARPARSAASWHKGDLVEINGALRRRFWRNAGASASSRYEVEVRSARRLAAAVTRQRKRE